MALFCIRVPLRSRLRREEELFDVYQALEVVLTSRHSMLLVALRSMRDAFEQRFPKCKCCIKVDDDSVSFGIDTYVLFALSVMVFGVKGS